MTRLVARLVLAMLILPLTGALFIVLFAGLLMRVGPPGPMRVLLVWAIIYLFVGVYWTLLWREMVRWTPERIWRTCLSVPAALAAGAAMGVACMAVSRAMQRDLAVLVGGGLVPIVWVLATVLIWRETPRERMERLSASGRETVCCPICGYNMTGLHEARCPECGSKFTLDQLVASQPERDKAVLRDD